jgi:hypothetical protein
MKYFKRLKIWKNSTGECTFDGKRGYSYRWFCICFVLPDGRKVINTHRYSNTTARHISDVNRILEYKTIGLKAPRGLTDTEATKRSLLAEKEDLTARLENKRVKKEPILARLAAIESELKLNEDIAQAIKEETKP